MLRTTLSILVSQPFNDLSKVGVSAQASHLCKRTDATVATVDLNLLFVSGVCWVIRHFMLSCNRTAFENETHA